VSSDEWASNTTRKRSRSDRDLGKLTTLHRFLAVFEKAASQRKEREDERKKRKKGKRKKEK